MEFNEFVMGLTICFLLSFTLGLERQIRRRFIGLRTMILVAVGCYLFVSFSFLVTGYQIDISRVASQVVAGIGFLGAGVIIKDSNRNKISGLTTAATLWCDASIGILCAGGFIKEAIVATLLVLFSNIILRYVNSIINNKTEERKTNEIYSVVLTTDIKETNKVFEYVTEYVNKNDSIDITNYNINGSNIELELTVKKSNLDKMNKFVVKVITDFNLKSYQYKKVSESKLEEDNEEL